tara:strand:+ start:1605 stop:1865 length:261 start_codon:yes stop_codon:yes gene_type:complete
MFLVPLNRASSLSNPLSFSEQETLSQEKLEGSNISLEAEAPLVESKNQIGLLPIDEIDQSEEPKESVDMQDLFGSEQVFPFEPGFS